MLTQVFNALLPVAAVLSSLGLFWAIANDYYGEGWLIGAICSMIVTMVCWIAWLLLLAVLRAVGLIHPETQTAAAYSAQTDDDDMATPALPVTARYLHIFFLIFAILCCLFYLACGVEKSRPFADRITCQHQLKLLGIALLNYHQKQGVFPPAYVADKNGKPAHSWRFAVLPFIEGDVAELSKEYDFSEPWDGPHNQKLIERMPRGYACPTDAYGPHSDKHSGKTNYVAIVGPNAAWQDGKQMKLSDFGDEPAKTALLIEIPNSDIAWTEPRDLRLDEISKLFDSTTKSKIDKRHAIPKGFFWNDSPGGLNLLRADGSAKFLPTKKLTPDKLEKILQIGGCPEDLTNYYDDPSVNGLNCGLLLTWIVSIYLLLRRATNENCGGESQPTEQN